MIIYRLTRSNYKDDISGYGSFLYGGRWNSKGQYAFYCAECISLAVLEIVVNYNRSLSPLLPDYYLAEIYVPDISIIEIGGSVLKKGWAKDIEYTRYIGDEFLQSKTTMGLKIPSAVIPEENNFILNPSHEDFKKLKINKNRLYDVDRRLL